MTTSATLTPQCLWAQRADKVFLTLLIQDAKDVKIDLTETELKVTALSGTNSYSASFSFYKKLSRADSFNKVSGPSIAFVLLKQDEEWWPRLLDATAKPNWLKTDFNKWRDEDDEGEDEVVDPSEGMNGMGGGGMPGGMDFSKMMAGMGGMNGMNGMDGMDFSKMGAAPDFGGDDSDDDVVEDSEDMPPLEDVEA